MTILDQHPIDFIEQKLLFTKSGNKKTDQNHNTENIGLQKKNVRIKLPIWKHIIPNSLQQQIIQEYRKLFQANRYNISRILCTTVV